jgi:hypothetical protein
MDDMQMNLHVVHANGCLGLLVSPAIKPAPKLLLKPPMEQIAPDPYVYLPRTCLLKC